MGLNVHKGWHVTGDRAAPVTGRWKASRHGIGMCAGSYEELVDMIDRRVAEEWRERWKREADRKFMEGQ